MKKLKEKDKKIKEYEKLINNCDLIKLETKLATLTGLFENNNSDIINIAVAYMAGQKSISITKSNALLPAPLPFNIYPSKSFITHKNRINLKHCYLNQSHTFPIYGTRIKPTAMSMSKYFDWADMKPSPIVKMNTLDFYNSIQNNNQLSLNTNHKNNNQLSSNTNNKNNNKNQKHNKNNNKNQKHNKNNNKNQKHNKNDEKKTEDAKTKNNLNKLKEKFKKKQIKIVNNAKKPKNKAV